MCRRDDVLPARLSESPPIAVENTPCVEEHSLAGRSRWQDTSPEALAAVQAAWLEPFREGERYRLEDAGNTRGAR